MLLKQAHNLPSVFVILVSLQPHASELAVNEIESSDRGKDNLRSSSPVSPPKCCGKDQALLPGDLCEDTVLKNITGWLTTVYRMEDEDIPQFLSFQEGMKRDCDTQVLLLSPDQFRISSTTGQLINEIGSRSLFNMSNYCLDAYLDDVNSTDTSALFPVALVCVPPPVWQPLSLDPTEHLDEAGRVRIPKCCPANQVYRIIGEGDGQCVDRHNASFFPLFTDSQTGSLLSEDQNPNYTVIENSIPDCEKGRLILNPIIPDERHNLTETGHLHILQNNSTLNGSNFCVDQNADGLHHVALICHFFDPPPFPPEECQSENVTCFRTCCPPGEIYIRSESRCSPHDGVDWIPPLVDLSEPLPKYNTSVPDTEYFYGMRPAFRFLRTCHKSAQDPLSFPLQMYPFRSSTDAVYLLADGSLYHAAARVSTGIENYCLTQIQIDSGKVEPFILYCVDDDPQAYDPSWYPPTIIIAVSISSTFLLLTVIILLKLPDAKKLHGKLQIATFSFLLISNFFLLALKTRAYRMPTQVDDVFCNILGFVTLFFFLAPFFWLNSMSFETWRIMRLAPGVPESYIRPKFSGDLNMCWLNSDRPEFWAFYLGPIAFLLACNCLFFVMTAFVLLSHEWNMRNIERNTHRNTAMLCLKLFAIMGIVWIAEVISAISFYSIGSLIFDVVTHLQGLFIFFVFILKNKAFENLRKEINNTKSMRTLRQTMVTRWQQLSTWRARPSKPVENIEEEQSRKISTPMTHMTTDGFPLDNPSPSRPPLHRHNSFETSLVHPTSVDSGQRAGNPSLKIGLKIKAPFLLAVKETLQDRYTENMDCIYKKAIHFILETLQEGFDQPCDAS
ncbi:unnamed protein product [Cyprideis torosa]|uniref:Uncharacterized protein n=1 Tax=Cyprideis torosa TaxID=163714 RepID=A0A7R8W3N8_9CRUS|nr:unnamed protein product [Cyprideis torosa]CAG0883246.1 unnamed protein product [Cyprideis torosa]